MKHFEFDVIVVGGGHAGTEAAHASARMGSRTALITFSKADIGVMSCNPAIGGLGKGHLVREIDAMDGLMGRAADHAGIQFRLLNSRKGPAVQGPRAQADRKRYASAIKADILSCTNLSVLEAEVVDLIVENNRVGGVVTKDATKIYAPSVIITTGTFLRGVIHIGEHSYSGGRMGNDAANLLSHRFEDMDLSLGRLKTGTPPRLDGRTIDWSKLDMQPGDDDPTLFSFLSRNVEARQISCGITHTNENTHEIIHRNLEKSAIYGGRIDGVGPRYCPSIEDKVVRFSDKNSHQIFLEPEGLDDDTVYPNGISTSLPLEIQKEYVASIRGLEQAVIMQPGYAIEYDFIDPRNLDLSLAVSDVGGLFLAGQINGTTGYEEAAAQGLVAGLNASLLSQDKDPIHFPRSESYIGVLIDDLTTRGVSEPYRMFTSRAEFRLSLRADNADQRLTPVALALGCVEERREAKFGEKMVKLTAAQKRLQDVSWSAHDLAAHDIHLSKDGKRRSTYALLAMPEVTLSRAISLDPQLAEHDQDVLVQLSRDALYQNYIERQARSIKSLKKDEAISIPPGFDFRSVHGLSAEVRAKLEVSRPASLGQANRIDGMTPAALTLLLSALRRARLAETG